MFRKERLNTCRIAAVLSFNDPLARGFSGIVLEARHFRVAAVALPYSDSLLVQDLAQNHVVYLECQGKTSQDGLDELFADQGCRFPEQIRQ